MPVHTGLTGSKGNRRCLLRADFHAYTVVNHTEAVSYVFDGVQVGYNIGNLITFFDLELKHTELGRNRGHVHTQDRKSTRLNSSHVRISYAVFCLKKKK